MCDKLRQYLDFYESLHFGPQNIISQTYDWRKYMLDNESYGAMGCYNGVVTDDLLDIKLNNYCFDAIYYGGEHYYWYQCYQNIYET